MLPNDQKDKPNPNPSSPPVTTPPSRLTYIWNAWFTPPVIPESSYEYDRGLDGIIRWCGHT